ncbi:alpha/beta fold hydrolase [Nocardioides sp. zg-579]|uniref:Alpha/beta fold hydrolase n=1 Tax=Nocardioides marmotae TaxID=2663857 RepID=A0A6I3JAF6_9ACTN|nr:alpha/beta fold hydrolase [Gordonia jinghuaiqii]MTB94255.1 alpha/beta fold hydrolase [Nocardioides marmotae]QKE03368.1 alpha/beta fold hydrolase [Nocardioides marmotae]
MLLLAPLALVGAGPAGTAAAASTGFPLPLPGGPGDPVGANDWGCRPTAERPTPVVLVHGTIGDRRSLLDPLSAAVKGAGFCVFSLDYGNRGTGDIAASAKQLKAFTNRVLAATGASKVSMVGHSQGGMMPRYYIKFLGGATVVDDLVGLAPSNHGTVLTGGTALAILTGPLFEGICVACNQQAVGSDFLRRLNAGDETPGKVSYTQVTTRYDEVVVPHLSGYLRPGPRTTNTTIQDSCPGDPAEHLLIPMSRTAIAWTLDALTRPGPARKDFRPAC